MTAVKNRVSLGDTFLHGESVGTVTALGRAGWTRTVTVSYDDGFVNVLSETTVLLLMGEAGLL